MTDDEIDAIRERWAAVTPGPWDIRGYGSAIEISDTTEADYEAVVAAPTDVAALLADVDRLRAVEAAVRATHARYAAMLVDYSLEPGDEPHTLVELVERLQSILASTAQHRDDRSAGKAFASYDQPTGRTRTADDGLVEHEYRGASGSLFWAVPYASR